jgi:hypothetical protein
VDLKQSSYDDSVSSDPYRQPEAIERSSDAERARNALTRDLMQDEEFVWAGRPKQGMYLSPSDLVLVPFSLVWGCFAIAWELTAVLHHAPFFFCLFGVPFVLLGAYLTVGRFFVDARSRSRTFYGVTNRRALIVTDGRTRRLTTVDLANSVEASLEERADGTGTISLGRRSATAFFEDASWPMTKKSGPPALRRIAGAREVFNHIRDRHNAQRARPT